MSKILVCWAGFGNSRLEEKEEWIETNYNILEATRENHTIDYVVFSYHNQLVNVPNKVKVVYRPGIVMQYIYEELEPDKLKGLYDYVYFMLDDVVMHPSFSIAEYINIYNRNNLNILQSSLDEKTVLSHGYMRIRPENKVGRLNTAAEFFNYLMDIDSYTKYYDTFLSEDIYWGWGIDLNVWHIGKLRVGILDMWPLSHRILGQAYTPTLPDPRAEFAKWGYFEPQELGQLV